MNSDKTRPIIEHVHELRKRVIRVMGAIVVFSFSIFLFSIKEVNIDNRNITIPYPDIYNNIASKLITKLQEIVLPEYVEVILTTPGQALSAQIYISLLFGTIVSMPLILWEIIGFIKPGLYETERKLLRNLLVPALVLFSIGALFSLFVMVPLTLEFLYKYGISLQAETFITINDFVSFITFFLLAFGIAFQLPIIMWLITKLGVVKNSFWKENWRYTLLVLVVLGAMITPDASGITMWLITIPMMSLYILGYIITRNIKTKDTTNK